MDQTNLLIAGKDRPASNGATFDRVSPVTNEVATRAAAATLEDADAAVAAAREAFPVWAAVPPTERRRRLLKAADLMQERAPEFIKAGVLETGGTKGWYGFNTKLASNMLREAASMTTQLSGEVIPTDVPGNMALAMRQPAGVVLGIAPWNAPVILGTRAVAMPLACGNTVVLKASEMCPAVHRLIGSVLHDAELGDGVVNVILNAPKDAASIVERLIGNPAVRRVNFTGSTHVGRIIAQLAAKHLKPVLLELGGKAPLVILSDADLDEAVSAAAFGAFFNQGQICMSTERIVVDESVADAFVEKLARKASSLSCGDPREGGALGCMVSGEAASRTGELLEDARKKGAKVVAGGTLDGATMQPTVVDGVTTDMRLYGEESFGPIVTVVRVKNTDEAVRVANDTEYGLSAAVFGRDIGRAMSVARQIESGICHINAATVHDEAQMPFGGMKGSGYGRFGGKAAIAEFTDLRWITVQTTPRHYPI
jgi:acyl-CoA reductase-like NAD-dependent aldehyde dehydrogenase